MLRGPLWPPPRASLMTVHVGSISRSLVGQDLISGVRRLPAVLLSPRVTTVMGRLGFDFPLPTGTGLSQPTIRMRTREQRILELFMTRVLIVTAHNANSAP